MRQLKELLALFMQRLKIWAINLLLEFIKLKFKMINKLLIKLQFLKWIYIRIFGEKVISINGNIIPEVYKFKGKIWMYQKSSIYKTKF